MSANAQIDKDGAEAGQRRHGAILMRRILADDRKIDGHGDEYQSRERRGAVSKREDIHNETWHKEELRTQAGEKTRQAAEKAESEKFEKFAREKYKELRIPYDSNPQ